MRIWMRLPALCLTVAFAVVLAAGGGTALASGWSGGYSGFSGGYSGGGFSGYSGGSGASGYSGSGWSGSGYANQSPYSNDGFYAGQDTLTMTIGGQTVTLQANEWAAGQGPSGYGYGNTVSSISTNQLSASQLAALQAAGLTVSNGQVEISPTAYVGGLPGGATVNYNGGTTDLYGGNGALTLNVPGTGATSGRGGGYSGGGFSGTSGGYSGSALAWSVSLAPSAQPTKLWPPARREPRRCQRSPRVRKPTPHRRPILPPPRTPNPPLAPPPRRQ